MKRPIVFVMLAGMGAVLAAFVVFSAIRKRESEVQRAMAHSVEVVVAAKDIPLGTKLDPDRRQTRSLGARQRPARAPSPIRKPWQARSPRASSSPTSRWSRASCSWAKRPRA